MKNSMYIFTYIANDYKNTNENNWSFLSFLDGFFLLLIVLTMPANYQPPLYSKVGKKVRDLLGKNFSTKNELKVKNKSAGGLELEALFGGCDDLTGQFKGVKKNKCYEFEGSIKTSGECSGKAVAKKLMDGLEGTLNGKYGGKKNEVSLKADYRADSYYALSLDVNHSLCNSKTLATLSCVIGSDFAPNGGINVGIIGKLDPLGSTPLVDANCIAEYSQADFSAHCSTEKMGDVINAAYWQKISGACAVAASIRMDSGETSEMEHVLTLGAEYAACSDTDFYVKFNTDGVLSGNIEHVLSDPKLKVNVGANFDSNKEFLNSCNNFGIAVTLGDF